MPVHASLFMVMPTLWNPVSLKFSDPVLEERYTSFRTQSTYSAIDTFYAWFSVGIGLVSAITAVIRGRELYLLASLVVGACGIFVLKAQRTNWYRNNRTVIMLVLRTLRMGNALVAITEPVGFVSTNAVAIQSISEYTLFITQYWWFSSFSSYIQEYAQGNWTSGACFTTH